MHGVFNFFVLSFLLISERSAKYPIVRLRVFLSAPLALYFRDAYADFLAVFAP